MYRVVSRNEAPGIQARQRAKGEPVPQIIDHRQGNQNNKEKQQTFEHIKKQRDTLLESEIKYAKRIKELEKEKEDLLKLYEPTYKENEQLKSHLLHGPESQNIKKLKQEKKKLLSELEIIKEENVELQERVKDLEKMFLSEKEYYLEKKWREAIEKGRTRREERDALVSTQGPFSTSRKPKKKDLRSVTDEEFEKQDAHDLHIDTLEKETQILLNKIRRIKQNKGSIDYAYFIGKGAITRNSSIAKAINEKLDKDLEAFENRLENLRKKTKQLKDNSSEELAISENKPKVKQIGTKYFRTRHTQTDLDMEQMQTDPVRENANMDQSTSKPIVITPNISRKGSMKGTSMINSQTPNVHTIQEHPNISAGKRNESLVKQDNRLYSRQSAETLMTRNLSQYSDERETYNSSISEHWRHLATKLNEAERFGGKTPYRNKIKGRMHVQSRSSKRQESLSYVPEKMTSTRPNSEEIETASAKSQRSIESIISKTLSLETTTPLSNSVENVYETDDLQNEQTTEKVLDTENGMEKGERTEKVQRKTTNLGEEIRFIPRQNSWQTGRYANSFEPINRTRKTDIKVSDANQGKYERKIRHSSENDVPDEYNEAIQRSALSKDSRTHQRAYSGDSVKRNTLQLQDGFKIESIRESQQISTNDNRRNSPKASSNLNRNIALRARSPSKDHEMVSRKVSAYDEVLADVKKQYTDQARRQMINSRIQLDDNNNNDMTRLTGNIYDEHNVDNQFDIERDNRSIFKREEADMIDRRRKSREYVYNLDLL